MYICYIDESGIPEIGSGTSHFVLLGLTIPAERWRLCDKQITVIKRKYHLPNAEIHAGWMLRRYIEQEKIPDFASLTSYQRKIVVEEERKKTILHKAALKGTEAVRETQKNFRKTGPYIHLTYGERLNCIRELCDLIGSWGECRLFADAINKDSFKGEAPKYPPYEEAFCQVVSRFERFLNLNTPIEENRMGILVQDNNETVAKKLTETMQRFHRLGTMFTDISRIIENPLFVSSSLTGMVQLADICAYSTRRYFEKRESDLFNRIYGRFNRDGTRLVGLRHYDSTKYCYCRVCQEH